MRRPLAITILGWLFIITGVAGIVRRIGDFDVNDPLFGNDAVWVMSAAHTTTELVIHIVFLVVLIVVLFNRNVSWYFR